MNAPSLNNAREDGWIKALKARADAELDHVMVGDHVSFHTGFGVDGLIQATAALVGEQRLAVHVGVYLLGLRNPVTTARQLSTIHQLAPGRLVLGVGAGGEDRHEIEICGVDPRRRGGRLDEAIAIVRSLGTGHPTTWHGEHFDFDDAVILPACDPQVPLVVGGRSNAAIARAAILGDGWLGIWSSPTRFAIVVREILEIADDIGREQKRWHHEMHVWCSFGEPTNARERLGLALENLYHLPFDRFERYCPSGSARDIADFLARYVDAGCASFNLLTVGHDSEQVAGAAEVRQLLNR